MVAEISKFCKDSNLITKNIQWERMARDEHLSLIILQLGPFSCMIPEMMHDCRYKFQSSGGHLPFSFTLSQDFCAGPVSHFVDGRFYRKRSGRRVL